VQQLVPNYSLAGLMETIHRMQGRQQQQLARNARCQQGQQGQLKRCCRVQCPLLQQLPMLQPQHQQQQQHQHQQQRQQQLWPSP
jgi:hypothetical protein